MIRVPSSNLPPCLAIKSSPGSIKVCPSVSRAINGLEKRPPRANVFTSTRQKPCAEAWSTGVFSADSVIEDIQGEGGAFAQQAKPKGSSASGVGGYLVIGSQGALRYTPSAYDVKLAGPLCWPSSLDDFDKATKNQPPIPPPAHAGCALTSP